MFVPATRKHFDYVLTNPAPFAASEFARMDRLTAEAIFENSFARVTVENAEGIPLCLFGLIWLDLMAGLALVWFVASSERNGRRQAMREFPGIAPLTPVTVRTVCASIETGENGHWASWCGLEKVTDNYYEWRR